VFAESLVVFPTDDFADFSVLQSRIHEIWARFFSSTLEDRLRYTPSDCLETFPFPSTLQSHDILASVGRDYYELRARIMIDSNKGLTKTYNRFHDPHEGDQRMLKLRELHDVMDRAVLDAYGWSDLKPQPVFLYEPPEEGELQLPPGHELENEARYWKRYFWRSEIRDDVLARLLALNVDRAEEELRLGLALVGRPHRSRAGKGGEDEYLLDGVEGA
jgi:hypothetical protein